MSENPISEEHNPFHPHEKLMVVLPTNPNQEDELIPRIAPPLQVDTPKPEVKAVVQPLCPVWMKMNWLSGVGP
jgi:hypothetical protein